MPLNLHIYCCYCGETCDNEYVEVAPLITAHPDCAKGHVSAADAAKIAADAYMEMIAPMQERTILQPISQALREAYLNGYRRGRRDSRNGSPEAGA